jgi:outer membrane receptor for Fe3+-dicitrate
MKKILLFILLAIVNGVSCLAQENESDEHFPMVRGAVMMANSHVPQATEGGKKVAVVPTWGIDLDYFFNSRWSVDVQSDIKLQSFEVEDNNAILQRTNPFSISTVVHYHFPKHWSFFAGPGYEFEKTKNLFIVKAGTEYSFEVSDTFEIGLNLIYENKQEVYDNYTFGITFNKKLWEKEGKDR